METMKQFCKFQGNQSELPRSVEKGKSKRLSFFESRQLRNLCDGMVCTDDGKSLPVHRILMSIASPFFRAAFVPEGTNVESKTCTVQGIQSDILQQIIDYVIDCQIDISDKNIQSLTLAADFFQMKTLLRECCDYVRDHISTRNCLAIYDTMVQLDHLDLKSFCYRYILINFEKFVNEEISFSPLPSYALESFLQSDDLNISGEETIWKAICLWSSKDQYKKQEVFRLMCYVRANQHELSDMCGTLYGEILKNSDLPQLYGHQYLQRPIPAENCHLIFETSSNQCTCRLTYDDTIDFWRFVADVPINPDVIASDSRGQAYMLKGDRCWALDLLQNRIQSIPNLRLHRRQYGAAVVDGILYVVGGIFADETSAKLTIVERYNPITKEWSWVQTTQFPCKGPVAVLQGKIYAFGERYYPHEQYVSFERYDPAFNSWTLMAPMPFNDDVTSVWTNDGCIFVASGHDGEVVINAYNPGLNSWKTASETFNQIKKPRICKVRETPVLYEGDETIANPKAFLWNQFLEKWTKTSDPFLRNIRHYQVFCVDDSQSLENLKNRCYHEWSRVKVKTGEGR